MNTVNTLKTILLLGLLGVLMVSIGRLVGGVSGMYWMLLFSIIINVGMYFFSDKIAIKSAEAMPLSRKKHPEIFIIVEKLSQKAKIPRPRIYVSPNTQPNAFATGRNPKNSAVVLTEGLMRGLEREEIKGVIAHELSHIKNRDVLIATLAAVVASVITGLSSIIRFGAIFGSGNENRNPLAEIVTVIFAPIAALVIQMAISRAREYDADELGAKLTGNPKGLASALKKIEYLVKNTEPTIETNPAFANLYIANPFSGEGIGGFFQKIFSTHPQVSERVERLMEMERGTRNGRQIPNLNIK